jgi:hypothetical protein
VTTPKDRAKMASDRNISKAIDKANARDRDTKRNWSGRGTSGDEIANKEYENTSSKFIKDMTTAMNSGDTDVTNAERYGRDAYKSRGFGQGKKDKPENKGSLNYAKGGKLEMVKKNGKSVPAFAADGVGKMNMGGKMNMADKKKMAKDRAVEAASANAKKAKDKFDSNFTGMSDKEKKRAPKGPMLKEFGQSMDGVRAGADSDVTNAGKYGADAYKSRGFGQSNKDRPESKYSLRYAKGGKIDGIAMKGKTKGRMC